MSSSPLAARVARLQACFSHIAATRMADVPICHPGLRVQSMGFENQDEGAVGVLITPWFMNLVWLPAADEPAPTGVGVTRVRRVGTGASPLAFLGAHEASFGAFEACSLFSPMQDFADQAAAVATAQEVLAQLRAPVNTNVVASATTPPPPPQRRGFLFGRSAA